MDSGDREEVELAEFFPTPRWAIKSLLESDQLILPGGIWIEPCAGTGRIISTVNSYRDDVDWIVIELLERFESYLRPLIRPGRDAMGKFGDFVHRPWSRPYADVLIMNPPFSLAMDFVKTAFRRAAWVVCLQRQNWFSKPREAWLRKHCPDAYALPKRASFRPDGKTDSCEYSWFVWPPGNRKRRCGKLTMLELPGEGQQSFAF
jgi:hypothetical protein